MALTVVAQSLCHKVLAATAIALENTIFLSFNAVGFQSEKNAAITNNYRPKLWIILHLILSLIIYLLIYTLVQTNKKSAAS